MGNLEDKIVVFYLFNKQELDEIRTSFDDLKNYLSMVETGSLSAKISECVDDIEIFITNIEKCADRQEIRRDNRSNCFSADSMEFS